MGQSGAVGETLVAVGANEHCHDSARLIKFAIPTLSRSSIKLIMVSMTKTLNPVDLTQFV